MGKPKKQRKSKEIMGEGCGELDGANVWRSADGWKIRQGSNVRKRISGREEEIDQTIRLEETGPCGRTRRGFEGVYN